jgi:hypothetical protein
MSEPWANLPWERLPGETDKAFKAFCVYRDLRQNRSFSALLDRLGKKSKTQFAVWSRKNNWQVRVRAFDDDEDRKNRIKQQESIQKMNERQAQQAETFQRIVFLPVTAFSERLKKDKDNKMPAIEDLNKLTTVELIDLIIQVSRSYGNLVNIERIARGVPTEIGRNENTILLQPQKDKFGEIVANDEESAEALLKFLSAVGDAQNGKPSYNGDVSVEREVSDSSSH